MKSLKVLLPFSLLLAIIIYGCKQDQIGEPLSGDKTAPGPISNPHVENTPGGAKISYTLPNNKNLLYVKAEYDLNGIKMEAKASYYKDTIKIEGFGDTTEREIKLYAVSRSEVASAPVTVTVKPLLAPIYDVYKSLNLEETFGGIIVSFENQAAITGSINSNVVLGTLMWDSTQNDWKQIDTHYSGLKQDSYSVRGLEPVPIKFGFFLKDRWGNFTDTLQKVLTPIYEVELDRSLWKDIRGKYPVPQVGVLPSSGSPMIEGVNYSGSYPMTKMWDDDTGTFYHTKQAVEQPTWNPFDLGVKAKLSRYKLWQRLGSGWPFTHGNPHEWELWGTNTPNDPNSWVLLDHEVMIKPSGLPVGQNSNDDNNAANAGEEYNFPTDAPAVRYISFKSIDNWDAIGGQFGFVHISELKIWGQE